MPWKISGSMHFRTHEKEKIKEWSFLSYHIVTRKNKTNRCERGNKMIRLAIVLGIAFLLQGLLSSIQMKNFSDEFVKLRRKGKVVVGRKAGGFRAGAIVMFLIDDKGKIKKAKKLEGVTFLARVKDFPGFEGKNVRNLTEKDAPRNHKNLGKAIADASLTYRKYMKGETIADPPSPFRRVAGAAVNLVKGGKKTKKAA